MAQLIKIYDYISRYETDIFHYPGRFIRLKKENWKSVYQLWEQEKQQQSSQETSQPMDQPASHMLNWRRLFSRKLATTEENDRYHQEDRLPSTENALKHYFLDSLFSFQLKWASTTVGEMSFIDRQLYDDFKLKYFLTRFPDTCLLLYKPVFKVKNQPIEGEIILVSPIGLEIIRFVEDDSSIEFVEGDDRTWYKESNHNRSKVISPMIDLKRTEHIVKSIFKNYDIDFPIYKIILSRTNTIKSQLEPYNTIIIDIEKHDSWLQQKKNLVYPLKHQQLKVCEVLLKHCYTVSRKRPEWDDDTDHY
ncbi:NERD domain-containing protein [Aquibacillus sediminis]|uniref:NERD domain-containing protein n=1 Tax=Aquibacillus sediminis TaxID=2574734 RepID=UPI0011087997|nr:NERD domain-containing protein [Aquibacillus sediminis]